MTERLGLVERADLRQGFLTLMLNKSLLADRHGINPEQINPTALTIAAPFQTRRRGVELKLHLGDPSQEIDKTLVQNIVKGRRWLAMVIDGKPFSEIAEAENISTHRVQDVANLSLIAPGILDTITFGEQPSDLTTNYLIKTPSQLSSQNSARSSPRSESHFPQTRTAGIANRDFVPKTTLKSLWIASHFKPRQAKRREARDNTGPNQLCRKSRKCLAGAAGFEPATYGFGDRRSTS